MPSRYNYNPYAAAESIAGSGNPWWNPYMPGPDIGRGMASVAASIAAATGQKEDQFLEAQQRAVEREQFDKNFGLQREELSMRKSEAAETARKNKAAEDKIKGYKLPPKTKAQIAEYFSLDPDEIDLYPPEFQQQLAEKFTEGIETAKTTYQNKAAAAKEALAAREKENALKRQGGILNSTNQRLEAVKSGIAKRLAGIESAVQKMSGMSTPEQDAEIAKLMKQVQNIERAQMDIQNGAMIYLSNGLAIPDAEEQVYSRYLKNLNKVLDGSIWESEKPASGEAGLVDVGKNVLGFLGKMLSASPGGAAPTAPGVTAPPALGTVTPSGVAPKPDQFGFRVGEERVVPGGPNKGKTAKYVGNNKWEIIG